MSTYPLLALSIICVLPHHSSAASHYQRSTSNWIPISEEAPTRNDSDVDLGIPNETYLTVTLLGAFAHANDNWWNSIVKTNSHIVVGARLQFPGGVETAALSEAIKVSSPNNFHYPLNNTIVLLAPLTRADYAITLTISHLADDGVAEMINSLQSNLPTVGLTVSPDIAGGVGIGKTLLDAIFKRRLAEDILACPYHVNGKLKSGVYAIFAGNDNRKYSRYEQSANNLRWANNVLSLKAPTTASLDPVIDCSYMVVRLQHSQHIYPNASSVYNSQTTWGNLYLKAKLALKPLTIEIKTQPNDLKTVIVDRVNTAQGFMNSAVEVLMDDVTLTIGERRFIAEELMLQELATLANSLTARPAAIVAELSRAAVQPAKSTLPDRIVDEGFAVTRGETTLTPDEHASAVALSNALTEAAAETSASFAKASKTMRTRSPN